jgi:hypothetical protein
MINPGRISHRLRLAAKTHPLLLEALTAPLALGVVFLLALGRFLGGDKSIATFPDNTHFYLPLFSHISRSFTRGHYPYWISNIVGGIPLYNTPQFPPTYPLYFFHAGLYATPLAALVQMHYVTFLHIFIALVNCYVLLRVLRLAALPSLLGAAVFAFSPNTFSYGVWINILAPYVWFPLIIAGVFLILENRRRRVGIILGAASLSLLIHASPAQPLIHAAYAVALLYLCNAARRLWHREFSLLLSATIGLVGMGLLTFALSASVLIPVLLNSKHMIRFIGDYPPVIGFAKLPFEGFLVGQLSVRQLAGALFPYDLPAVIGDPFVGLAAVLLALFAVANFRRNWLVAPLVILSLYGLLSATGDQLGLAQLNYRLPLINKIREPGRHLFLFVLGVSCLSAIGFDYLLRSFKDGYRASLSKWHLLPVSLFMLLLASSYRAGLTYKGSVAKPALLALFAVTALLLLALPRLKSRTRTLAAAFVVALVVYANLQYPFPVPKLERGDYLEAQNLISHRVLSELAQIPDVRDYRIFFADKSWNTQFWPMNAIYYDLRGFEAFMNPLPSYRQFTEMYQRSHVRHYYPLLGGKYYVCKPCDDPVLADYQFQREIEGYGLYVNEQALPRYTLLNRVAGAYTNQTDDFYNRIEQGFDYAREAYLSEGDAVRVRNWLGEQTEPPSYLLKPERASLNELAVSVNTNTRALFLLNEYYSENWQARRNGVPVKPLRVNLNQMGVLLEAGGNLIEFEYHPTLFIWLLRVQKIVLALLVLYILSHVPKPRWLRVGAV